MLYVFIERVCVGFYKCVGAILTRHIYVLIITCNVVRHRIHNEYITMKTPFCANLIVYCVSVSQQVKYDLFDRSLIIIAVIELQLLYL